MNKVLNRINQTALFKKEKENKILIFMIFCNKDLTGKRLYLNLEDNYYLEAVLRGFKINFLSRNKKLFNSFDFNLLTCFFTMREGQKTTSLSRVQRLPAHNRFMNKIIFTQGSQRKTRKTLYETDQFCCR